MASRKATTIAMPLAFISLPFSLLALRSISAGVQACCLHVTTLSSTAVYDPQVHSLPGEADRLDPEVPPPARVHPSGGESLPLQVEAPGVGVRGLVALLRPP